MPKFRVYVEEISTRLFVKTVEAADKHAANALLVDAIESDEWMEWDHTSADCQIERRPEMTEEEK